MKKGKKVKKKWRIGAFPAIVIRIVALSLAIWLATMGLITYTAAVEIQNQMQYEAVRYAHYKAYALVNYTEKAAELPGYADYCRIHSINSMKAWINIDSSFPFLVPPPEGAFYDQDDEYLPLTTAIIYYDKDGNELQRTNRYLSFTYLTSETWDAGMEMEKGNESGYAYIDLREVKELDTFEMEYYGIGSAHLLRLTGYFEGNKWVPVTIDQYSGKHGQLLSQEKTFSDWDREGKLFWQNRYTCATPTDKELMTIYTFDIGYSIWWNIWDTQQSAELLEMVDHNGIYSRSDSLLDTIVVEYGWGTDIADEQIKTVIALRAEPLPYVMEKMRTFYVDTFVLVAVAVFFILWRIRRHLIKPLQQVVRCSTGNPLPLTQPRKPRWRETALLEENYSAMQQVYQETQLREKQLSTALEFAQTAEEKRRQMVSNITHELKTPLAIIHSYAEGLQAGIAADKQEQYIATILEETERMDAMVLEMLDLSRLEAGKVRLAADQFSLLGLTRSIFDKLVLTAEEKGLEVIYDLTEEFEIVADEARIGQVVTNFATNAIKYTPNGGKIWVRVYRYKGQTYFAVENECAPLPEETLEKVWESFYRADPSRSEKGTGLGLTVARAIIELHNGKCLAKNTPSGVEFRFTLS